LISRQGVVFLEGLIKLPFVFLKFPPGRMSASTFEVPHQGVVGPNFQKAFNAAVVADGIGR